MIEACFFVLAAESTPALIYASQLAEATSRTNPAARLPAAHAYMA